MIVDFNTYMPLAMRTAKTMPTREDNLKHATIGIVTELGEFATEVKRHTIYGRPLTEAMCDHMIEEIFDTQWYIALALTTLDADYVEPSDDVKREMSFDGLLDMTLAASVMAYGLFPALGLFNDDDDDTFDDRTSIDVMRAAIYMLDRIATQLGYDPDVGRTQNIEKLRARFPDAYSNAAAEARADKGGLDARQS